MSAELPDILVVDDEPHIVRTLVYVLRKEGYSVETAADGEQALAMVRAAPPALLLTDGMMPRLDGYTLCRTIRGEQELTRQPYVVMLTAGGQDADRDRAELAGIDEFLTKPFSPSRLLMRVRALIGESR